MRLPYSGDTCGLFTVLLFFAAGIAKDLTKLGGKTVTKLVTPDEKQGSLFKLVSFITGEIAGRDLRVPVDPAGS